MMLGKTNISSSCYLLCGKLENHLDYNFAKKGQNLASIWDGLTEKHNVQVIRVLKMLDLSVYLLIYQFIKQEPKKGREKQLCKHQGARHLFLYYFHTSFLMSLFFVCFGQN